MNRPASPVSGMYVLYIHKVFLSEKDSSEMYGWLNYGLMPKLMRTYAPKVLEVNGLSRKYQGVTTDRNSGKNEDYLLVVEFVEANGMLFTGPSPGTRVVHMYADAKLVRGKHNEEVWSIRLLSTMGVAPLKDILFDEEFTYGLMETILNKMHKDQIISLAEGEAIIPSVKAFTAN